MIKPISYEEYIEKVKQYGSKAVYVELIIDDLHTHGIRKNDDETIYYPVHE